MYSVLCVFRFRWVLSAPWKNWEINCITNTSSFAGWLSQARPPPLYFRSDPVLLHLRWWLYYSCYSCSLRSAYVQPTIFLSLSLSITQLNVIGGGRWLVERPLDQFANFYYFIKQEWTVRERKREAREGGISRARTKMTLSRFVSSSPVHSIKRGRKLKKLINPIKRRDNRREIISWFYYARRVLKFTRCVFARIIHSSSAALHPVAMCSLT